MLEVERDQVGGGARRDLRRRQAQAAGAVVGEAAPERRRRALVAGGDEHVAATAQAARAALGLAGLLEGVEAHVRIGAERDRHASLPELGGRQEAVAEIGLGGRAGAHGRARLREQVELAGRDVRRVHDRRRRAEHAAVVEVLDRPQAELLERLLDLARLLAGVDVERIARAGARARAIATSHSRGTARSECGA